MLHWFGAHAMQAVASKAYVSLRQKQLRTPYNENPLARAHQVAWYSLQIFALHMLHLFFCLLQRAR